MENTLGNNGETIRKHFRNRRCWTLSRPVHDEQQLHNVENIPYCDLQEDFRVSCEGLIEDLLRSADVLKISNSETAVPVDGKGFAELVKTYVEALNSGVTPNLQQTFSAACEQACMEAYNTAVNFYKDSANSAALPLNNNEVETLQKVWNEKAVEIFKQRAKGDDAMIKRFSDMLARSKATEDEGLTLRNREKSTAFCGALAEKLRNEFSAAQYGPDIEARAKSVIDSFSQQARGPTVEIFKQELAREVLLVVERKKSEALAAEARRQQQLIAAENARIAEIQRQKDEAERKRLEDVARHRREMAEIERKRKEDEARLRSEIAEQAARNRREIEALSIRKRYCKACPGVIATFHQGNLTIIGNVTMSGMNLNDLVCTSHPASTVTQ
eukprot:TRINITY_DN2355_c0_g1_i2.p1 TRINITY_DN2355_c0_g1~~TRINITY_DN2355_c0_g1_i2.p1  ORF type:complete len:386 (+),score=98.24 TRINITY_DN2355_c0_g1_i2:1772-2929(+)